MGPGTHNAIFYVAVALRTLDRGACDRLNKDMMWMDELQDEVHEECGVFGAYDMEGRDVAASIYYGLFALQHRGQESCGIAVSDTYGPKGVV